MENELTERLNKVVNTYNSDLNVIALRNSLLEISNDAEKLIPNYELIFNTMRDDIQSLEISRLPILIQFMKDIVKRAN